LRRAERAMFPGRRSGCSSRRLHGIASRSPAGATSVFNFDLLEASRCADRL
jgi:hypothetical protein